jgi:hypothetical protein
MRDTWRWTRFRSASSQLNSQGYYLRYTFFETGIIHRIYKCSSFDLRFDVLFPST